MTTSTLLWDGRLTAVSSIAHIGESRGTVAMLRRELVLDPAGRPAMVPIISGNALRHALRVIGEELLRDALDLEGALPLAAAHALRSGGSLAKVSGAPLTGARRHQIRDLVPQIGLFGCAAAGTLIDGCLQVGKVLPVVAETSHITGQPATMSVHELVQIEDYAHQPDGLPDDEGTGQMRFSLETFPAGTCFTTQIRLDRATSLQTAFCRDILDHFARNGRLGGRTGIGHGRLTADWGTEQLAAGHPPAPCDWRAELAGRRDEILTALKTLT